MDLVQALVLGLMQGLLEWLPVSSQGQIAVTALTVFNVPVEEALNYAIFLHLGTLISAIAYFRRELKQLLCLENKPLLKFLTIAVLVTGLTALPSYFFLKNLAASSLILLTATGIFLILTGLLQKIKGRKKAAQTNRMNALFLGLGQGFAVLPGISRSGITTSVLLFEGFKPEQAFRLSFLLSIPSVFLGELLFNVLEPVSLDLNAVAALAMAALIGFISMNLLIKAARKINFSAFCLAFGAIYILLALALFW